MENLLDKFIPKRESREPQGIRHEKTVAPRVAACRLCNGSGYLDNSTCQQCNGSGRVIIRSEVTTYITAYVPEKI